ncbi:hypothetical protein POM88_026423 [Heracleum sosnowskyi]|uniref:Plant self-incompatibility S1 n=1 Tax=Heracleum sosnowskyi TaxID=360622 RepID=A0AAD8I738_9APIA|nr:hypothetical protein POM88_026423 [Heracleum sosnowskyi]
MASPRISLLLLVLTLYICTGQSKTISTDNIDVRITNKIASSTIDVACSEEGDIIVNPNTSHDWIVWNSSSKYYCEAIWTVTNHFASIVAYSRRFTGLKIVFWEAREDGWYVSRDGKSGWKKEAEWESEIVN